MSNNSIVRNIVKTGWSELSKSDQSNFDKLTRWRDLYKSIVLPVRDVISILESIQEVSESLCILSSTDKNSEKYQSLLGELQRNRNVSWLGGKDISSVQDVVTILRKIFTCNSIYPITNHLIKDVLDSIEQQSEFISLGESVSLDGNTELPSLWSFIWSMIFELKTYLDILMRININGDNSVISKIDAIKWFQQEKLQDNSYIQLPYFLDAYEQIERLERPNKVWQVVLKWPPWTWKTRFFEFMWVKKNRPIRVISMHQYINFYELLVQNTNLAPTKNRIDLVNQMLQWYESMEASTITENLKSLFEKHKAQFPEDYTLLEFVNSVFGFSDKKLESLDEEEEVKKYVVNSLNFWKQEENFSILVNKKEVVKWHLLDCIDKWEIPVLDEIDKVKEEEVDGILAFLDLETWRSHNIPGIVKPVYIPEWFWVYATSNDKYKPTWPLWRRFNSVELEYLDMKNIILYTMMRVLNSNLDIQFNDHEIEQFLTCLRIIEDSMSSGDYDMLDFSIRLVDNFINACVRHTDDGKVEKKSTPETRYTYILDGLESVISAQNEDIYGQRVSGNKASELQNQKKSLLERIQQEKQDITKPKLLRWRSVAYSKEQLVSQVLKKLDLSHPILDKITAEIDNPDSNLVDRELDFSWQISSIFSRIDQLLRSSVTQTSEKQPDVESFKQSVWDNILFSYDSAQWIFSYSVDSWSTFIQRPAMKVIQGSREGDFIIQEEDSIFTFISVEKGGVVALEEEELVDAYYCMWKEVKIFADKVLFWDREYTLYQGDTVEIQECDGTMRIFSSTNVRVIVLDSSRYSQVFSHSWEIDNESELVWISLRDLWYDNLDYTIKSYNLDVTLNYIFVTVEWVTWELQEHIVKLS